MGRYQKIGIAVNRNRFTLINGRAFKDNEFEEDGTYRILRVGNLFSNPVWYSSSLELEPDKYCEKGDLIYSLVNVIWTIYLE